MKRKLISLALCLAILSVFIVPAAALAAKPLPWAVGDQWVYSSNYVSGAPQNVVDNTTLTMTVADVTTDKKLNQFDGVFVPVASRIDNALGAPLAVPGVTVFNDKKNMLYTKMISNIVLAGNPFVAWILFTLDPKQKAKWPPVAGATWTFGKETVLPPPPNVPFIDTFEKRKAVVVGLEEIAVSGVNYLAYHVQEFDNDPASPTYLGLKYEHWFSKDAGSDVKMIDNGDTFKGVETRVLTSSNWGPQVTSINPITAANGSKIPVSVTISGSNFNPLILKKTKVTIYQHGIAHGVLKPKKIKAKNVVVSGDGNTITCDLTLTKAIPGSYDVEVLNPNKRTGRLIDGFTVTAATP